MNPVPNIIISTDDTFVLQCDFEESMPVMQLFAPANMPAIALDHDYLVLTPQDEFLRQEKVPVSPLYEKG